MRSTYIVLFLSILAVLPAAAQTTPPTPAPTATPAEPQVFPCPKVDIRSVNQPVRDGVPLKFSAGISGGDPKVQPLYDWSLSSGSIKEGQGTGHIDVDTTGSGVDKSITATLLVGGYAPECTSTTTLTVGIAGPAQKVDEFGFVTDEEEAARLAKFQSLVTPSDIAYVFVYGGKQGVRGAAYAELKKLREMMLKSGFPADHLATIDGGYRETATQELWVVPIGAEPPRPTPTVAVKDVTFLRPPTATTPKKP